MKRIIEVVASLFFFLALAIPNSVNATLTDNLVASWQLDNNASDSSGNNHNGTVIGAVPTYDRFGQANRAFQFNGASYIDVHIDDPASYAALSPTDSITVSAWFKYDYFAPAGTYSWPTIVKMFDGLGGYSLETSWVYEGHPAFVSNFRVQGSSDDHSGKPDGTPATTDVWYFLAASFDGNSFNHYSGQYDSVTGYNPITPTPNSTLFAGLLQPCTSGDLNIGRDPYETFSNRYFRGAIDDVRIWNRALSSAEVNELYHVPEPSTIVLVGMGASSLVYFWRRRRVTA